MQSIQYIILLRCISSTLAILLRRKQEVLRCMQGAEALPVRAWLATQVTDKWIGRRGPTEWHLRSPRLTASDFVLWRWAKGEVYRSNHTSARRVSISHRRAMLHFIQEKFHEYLRQQSVMYRHSVGFYSGLQGNSYFTSF